MEGTGIPKENSGVHTEVGLECQKVMFVFNAVGTRESLKVFEQGCMIIAVTKRC